MIANKLVFGFEFQGHSNKINSLCFSSNKLLATASEDRTIKIWQLKTGNPSNIMLFSANYSTSIAFSQDNKILISGEKDNTIKLWSLQTQKLIRILIGHQQGVNSVAVHPNGK